MLILINGLIKLFIDFIKTNNYIIYVLFTNFKIINRLNKN